MDAYTKHKRINILNYTTVHLVLVLKASLTPYTSHTLQTLKVSIEHSWCSRQSLGALVSP